MANRSKASEFSLVDGPFKGYRAREDITMLPPGILVRGSQNVLTNTSQRVAKRKGYTIDGQTSSVAEPITSSYDWTKILNNDTHVRQHGTVLEYRYKSPLGVVEWRNLASGFTTSSMNYTTYFDTPELSPDMLFVNGSSFIYEWSGGVTTYASSTATTITKEGTTSWIQDGFYAAGNITASTIGFVNSNPDTITDSGSGFVAAGFRAGQKIKVTGSVSNNNTFTISKVTPGIITLAPSDTLVAEAAGAAVTIHSVRQIVLNGTTYTYTGGESTTTLTGVTPNVTAGAVGDVMHQAIRTMPNSAMLGMSASFINDGIANLNEQIYIGSLNSFYVYVSLLSDPYEYTFSLPRLPGEGAKKTLTGFWRSFMNQEQDMYISAGADLWYKTNYVQTTTTTTVAGIAVSTIYEQINFEQLKTTSLQAAQSQAVTTKIQNDIMFLSNEPIINRLGRVDNILGTPQMTDISFPIIDDMNQYDFTGASMIYFRQFIYVAVPVEGIVLVYNMTNNTVNATGSANHYWEAPQTIPVSRFSIIDGSLYGHSSAVTETYKLFDGYRDRYNGGRTGSGINGVARFSFQNYGVRTTNKSMNEFFVEGYISPNTLLTIGIQYDIDGCATDTQYILDGSDERVVCIPNDDNSLGKFPLGTNPLGANLIQNLSTDLPPKFRVIKTFPRVPFYEQQSYFESSGKDEQWEIIGFGGNVAITSEGNVAITE